MTRLFSTLPCKLIKPGILLALPLLVPACLFPVLSSCTVGSDYQGPPELHLADSFAEAGAKVSDSLTPMAGKSWWQKLGDRNLDHLVDEALQHNHDIAIAGQRILEARALRKQAAASLAPRLGTNLALSRINPKGSSGTSLSSPGLLDLPFDNPTTIWQGGFEAGWEIDIFGGKRREIRGAKAREEATAANAEGVRLAVAAEVTEAYFSLASLHEQRTLILAQIDSQEEQVKDLGRRRKAGAVSQLDLKRAIGRLETTRAGVSELEAGITAQTQRIALVLGKQAGELETQNIDLSRAHLPEHLPMTQTGLPAGLLHRRPDLRKIERDVAAAAEDVGVAVASFYPSFRIGGGPSATVASFGDLFNASRFFWQFGPSIEWNPFTGGANRAALDAANARQKATLIGYEKAVLSAVSEVETQLASLRAETRRLAALQRAETALNDAVTQVRTTQAAGASSFLDVLIEEERLREIQLSSVQSKARLMVTWILLHKALGGSSPVAR